MTDFPDLKLKALVNFPASVVGGPGIDVTQRAGQYSFNLDFGELAQVAVIPAPAVPTSFVALWESSQDTFRRMSVADLQTQIGGGGGGGGGVSLIISDTPPVGVSAGALWWNSINGQLFVYYNDGTSLQWVIAVPTSDPSTFIAKAGDTVPGLIGFTQSPTAPTPPAGDNSNKVATTAFVTSQTFTRISNFLTLDVPLNNMSAYFDGPSVAQGPTGVWFASAAVTCTDTIVANFFAKLWDGTNVAASGNSIASVANGRVSFSLSGIFVNPPGNIRLSVNNPGDTTGRIEANRSGGGKDSSIYAFRIG